jgi:hypothetical protein
MLEEWALDIRTFDEQRAAVRRQEEVVAMEQQAVQQAVVQVVCLAKLGHH